MKFWSAWHKLRAENHIMKVVVIVMAFAVGTLGVTVNRLINSQKIIITPPVINKEFWIAGNTVSKSYIEQVIYFVADRVLTVSPSNVDQSLQMIMPFITHEKKFIRKIKTLLDEFAGKIKRDDIEQTFYPLKFYIDKKKSNRVILEGILKKEISGIDAPDKDINFIIEFDVINGRLLIELIEVEK